MTVSKRIDASSDIIWALLADFADVSWIPVAGDVTVEGDGPGMTRRIGGSGAQPIVETLLWLRPDKRTLAYAIENNPLAPGRFEATVAVDGDDPTIAKWDIEYESGDDDAATREGIEVVYQMIADWLRDAATSPRDPR